MWTCSINLLLLGVVAVIFAPPVHGVAVMSVDLGSEWMKIAVVSPGMPMEIALNKESKRKTPVAVAFRDGERVFGEDALNVGSRFPKQAYIYLLDVLGKTPDNPLVQQFVKRFPQYEIIADPETGLAVFQHDENTVYTPEELLAMILNKAREYAQDFSDQRPIRDVVITVPVFFNQAERRAMLRAAELADLNTAAALNYGIFRRKEFNETPQRILFFDMGASSTVATVASYQVRNGRKWWLLNPYTIDVAIGVFGCPPTIVKCQLDSNFSKPKIQAANSGFWSRLTHQLLGRLRFTIPNLQMYLPKKANFEMLGLGIDNLCKIVFLSLRMNTCLKRVNDRHFWNPEVFSYAMILRCRPNSRVFFHRHIYSLCLNPCT